MGWFLRPTNFTNFRASECRAELVRAMPSAAENHEVNEWKRLLFAKIRFSRLKVLYSYWFFDKKGRHYLFFAAAALLFYGYKKSRTQNGILLTDFRKCCGAYGTRTRDPMRDRHVF